LPYCTTAENVIYKYLGDPLWEKFEFHENNSDEHEGMKMVFLFNFSINYF
jgi:hypothetical protein